MPSDFESAVHKQGNVFTPQMIPEMFAVSATLFEDLPPSEVVISRDHSYGPDARNRLDIHLPSSEAQGLPAIVYIHGGGFIEGDKQMPGTPFYDTIGRWAAEAGYAGVTMTYRLAPQNTWPAGAEDVASAISWIRENAAQHGIDPDRIAVIGHSAGAAHAADYLAGQGGRASEVAAAVLLSGIYDARIGEVFPPNLIYYGDDPSTGEAQSSIAGLAAFDAPLLFGTAQLDPPGFQEQTLAAVNAYFEKQGSLPGLACSSGHNHLTSLLHIGSADATYGDAILRFLKEALG
jgi:acetyl esterase/lipase